MDEPSPTDFLVGCQSAAGPHRPLAAVRSQRLFWSHAAAFGALWGSLEITLGSFLHNLRVPFGGFVLTAVGAALLVAQRQLHPAAGLTVATGCVAAACKSISPGGVIFGPMVAIVGESLLVELALLMAPRARPSAALAGMLALQWTTGQAVLGQYVYFGGDVLELYLQVLGRLAQRLGWRGGAPWLLAVVLGGLAVLGAAVGLAGHRVGRRAAGLQAAAPDGGGAR